MKNAKAKTTKQTAAVAAQGAPGTAGKSASNKTASQPKEAPKAAKAAKVDEAKPAAPKKQAIDKNTSVAPAAKEAKTPHTESKGAKILAMIARPEGATLADIMKATEWLAHSVRGFISTAGKKHKIESTKDDSGARVYKVAK